MTNVRRPIHLQLRPQGFGAFGSTCSPGQTPLVSTPLSAPTTTTTTTSSSTKPLSPTGDSLPSQIMPHLFVGNLQQTNRETLNRINISYILSLGMLPIISDCSPTSPSSGGRKILMPSQNSSKNFKIRIKSTTNSNSNLSSTSPQPDQPLATSSNANKLNNSELFQPNENINVKATRYIHCKCINIGDNSDQNLAKFFDEAHQFIDEARRKKCNILVHCLAGVSRSPTIAIAYLMRINSLRFQDAYKLVKECRPQIDPNLNFMGQLMVYDKDLRGRSQTNESK